MIQYALFSTQGNMPIKPAHTLPSEWVRVVTEILELRKAKTYSITIRAREDFEMIFPERFSEEILSVMVGVLRQELYTDSRRVLGMDPTGETYEFLFPLDGRRMYGKINLKEGHVFVQVISTHLQQKDNIESGRFE